MNQLALDLQPTSREYRIELSRGQFAIVDEADFTWLNQWKWTAAWNPHTRSFYARRNVAVNPRPHRTFKTISMARLILGVADGTLVDHENHNTLDNRRRNLRPASTSQNACNRRTRTDNKCGIKGVCLHKSTGKWRAVIHLDGIRTDLGLFLTKEQAGKAYADAAKQLHGTFAHV